MGNGLYLVDDRRQGRGFVACQHLDQRVPSLQGLQPDGVSSSGLGAAAEQHHDLGQEVGHVDVCQADQDVQTAYDLLLAAGSSI